MSDSKIQILFGDGWFGATKILNTTCISNRLQHTPKTHTPQPPVLMQILVFAHMQALLLKTERVQTRVTWKCWWLEKNHDAINDFKQTSVPPP